ncbi:hypothetical protein SAMN06297251_10960 [Fulvimarina manganoxydans]|uniref:Uncharacterized protein n=1 Tax=Fulvimarina manganoxydans TaxID=937218 RepID=A0A1W2C982_9HYPH|nr:hypothetical protein SAMN06297251_10960 [Fulvimarina manganoxydans]
MRALISILSPSDIADELTQTLLLLQTLIEWRFEMDPNVGDEMGDALQIHIPGNCGKFRCGVETQAHFHKATDKPDQFFFFKCSDVH